ncbi:MetQ/NlpA family ABC transporter substrate-binding protein [Ignatzschineria cameli]|uniref:Methionine ABC transporter substrate-binding protein n=1 Tax=Ignatzschineria cameli TaxID=2182793 RepID=A0A2U2AKN4_9GAMM|nr:MetQ/NlpA family ABC transporter substrate-binding protein [Ignatzschineria cameli]PWD83576.1 methionine ABC transporter substrate-binding protein [Ignatzschineria cameli]PWD83741.1 methionine ABC transporter substrate-binding protein [Ignatzschineria cameli]PWD88558.1 methionine ABC transporter substrate-binding protein [Ignatzschineria cameli]PWD89994.1 methionine ABC transporter substrate-binding protein [Ignatzschineria cameli]PWD90054.1 methionine ABC transporter substrate-binding prot
MRVWSEYLRKRLSKRGIQFYKNISRWALVIVIGSLVMACGKSDEKTIVLGFGPSTYAEQFEYGIKPILEKEGYDVRVKIFSQNMQINPALIGGDIDVAGHQSEAYMKKMNQELKGNMVKLADTASAPQSLRSNKYQSLDEVRAGMRVAIPNDPVNGERAARILESISWVEVTNDDVSRFSVNDIKSLNGIEVIALDPAQGLRVLDEVDYAVINGNYVASAGLKISDGLVVEKTPAEHVVIIVIREDDVEKPWAQALKSAYESSEFESYIKSEPLFDGFILPKAWER